MATMPWLDLPEGWIETYKLHRVQDAALRTFFDPLWKQLAAPSPTIRFPLRPDAPPSPPRTTFRVADYTVTTELKEPDVIEIVDANGLILGLLEGGCDMGGRPRRHGDYVKFHMMSSLSPMSFDPDPSADSITETLVTFVWHEIPIHPANTRRWYLKPTGPIPEELWATRGFIDLRASFGRPVPLKNKIKGLPTGMVPSEIVAWRAWKVYGDKLHSVSVGAIWYPGMPMQGDPSKEGEGVHAFRERKQAIRYVEGADGIVVGEVELWGRVVEHEKGYRAQFAAIKSLQWADSNLHLAGTTLDYLRHTYGVEKKQPL